MRFEHTFRKERLDSLETQKLLDRMSADGWELVSAVLQNALYVALFFKRPTA